MSERLSIAQPATDPVEVELWGKVYTLKPLTRTVEMKLDEKVMEIDQLSDVSGSLDDVVEAVATAYDLLLASSNGTPKPSTTVKKAWKDDEVSSSRLTEFFTQLRVMAGRPF